MVADFYWRVYALHACRNMECCSTMQVSVCIRLALSLQFGVWIAYLLVAYCYWGVGFAGYHAFGNKTGSQIMYSLGHPIWVICLAEIMIIVHVFGSFQVNYFAPLSLPWPNNSVPSCCLTALALHCAPSGSFAKQRS